MSNGPARSFPFPFPIPFPDPCSVPGLGERERVRERERERGRERSGSLDTAAYRPDAQITAASNSWKPAAVKIEALSSSMNRFTRRAGAVRPTIWEPIS